MGSNLLGYVVRVDERPQVIPCLAASALLIGALGSHPYGYYTFLRWVVCATAVLVAWVAWQSLVKPAAFLFLAVAILFNPFTPVTMTRESWAPVDLACAVLFALGALVRRAPYR